MKRILLLVLVVGVSACVRPRINSGCDICWKPAPCDGEWIGLSEGGCALVVPEGTECPTEGGSDGEQ